METLIEPDEPGEGTEETNGRLATLGPDSQVNHPSGVMAFLVVRRRIVVVALCGCRGRRGDEP
jgi:hypothetical protein